MTQPPSSAQIADSSQNPLERAQRLSPEKRALLAARIRQQKGVEQGISARPRNAGQTLFPLSSAQSRLWFLEQWEPGNPAYVQVFDFRLTGKIGADLLSRCLHEIIRRHEALRTTFVLVDGQPRQQIQAEALVPMPVVDLSGQPPAEREAEAQAITLAEARQAFDLVAGPLLRAKLLRLDDNEHRLLVTMHHIVTDAWSLNLLMRELATLYSDLAQDKPFSLREPQIQYPDFACWQQEWLQSPACENQLAYWRERLRPYPVTLDLPADRPRPALQTFRGAKHFYTLPSSLATELREMCRREGVTLFMLGLAAFSVLLFRYTGQEDILVGSPIANRNHAETEALIGFFTNTLVLPASLDSGMTFRDLLGRVRQTCLEAYDHQDVPFERIVEELSPERDLSRSALFQVMFQTISVPANALPLPGAELEYREFDNHTAKFDLTLQIAEMRDGLCCTCEYNTDLYDEATIVRLARHYETLLSGLAADPEQAIGRLPLITEEERRQFIERRGTPGLIPPGDRCLPQLIEEWASGTPQAIAVQYEDQRFTYGELNARANQLAGYLRQQGIGPGALVGVYLERSLEMVVALLAIMKAGGAYVPMDPVYPAERLEFMLRDTECSLLLTQEALLTKLPEVSAGVFCLDRDWGRLAGFGSANVRSETTSEDLAYVIYTSGSTGRPKGVAVSHRSLTHLLETTQPLFHFNPEDAWTVFHSYAFDFSVWEIWSPLASGARLVVLPVSVTQSPEALRKLLERDKVTVLNLTPSALRGLIEVGQQNAKMIFPSTLRLIVCGGEALPGEVAKALLGCGVPVWNFYGPTEATVWAAIHQVTEADTREAIVPLGFPLPNVHLSVLDANLSPVPAGIPGELYIGGPNLAQGYWNRPELTAERFIPDPYALIPGERLYKTGDLARCKPDGEFYFLGRMDHQVKLRGFRVELGEIEARLNRCPGVQGSLVTADQDSMGTGRLIAYVVPDPGRALETGEMRRFLQESLPDYMVPAAFVTLGSFPLNAHGKIDRRALPAPDLSQLSPDKTFVVPGDDLELQLAHLWEKVLGVRPVGVTDNFFDLGGHSLMAVRLFAKIEKRFEITLPLAVLFQASTVAQLAEIIRGKGWSSPYTSLVPIQPRGSRRPLFCVHGAGGEVLFYHDLAHHLGEDQPVYGFQAQGRDGKHPWHSSVEEMAAHYIQEMRTVQEEGPYLLCGASLGGVVAFEMAQQLTALGQKVDLLGYFDSFHPRYLRYRPGVTRLHRKVYGIFRSMEHHVGSLRLLSRRERWRYVRDKSFRAGQEFLWVFEDLFKGLACAVLSRQGKPVPPHLKPYSSSLRAAIDRYQPTPYPGRITIFRATKQPIGIYPDRTLGWEGLADEGIVIHDIPSFHAAMVSEPRVSFLADKLRPYLTGQ